MNDELAWERAIAALVSAPLIRKSPPSDPPSAPIKLLLNLLRPLSPIASRSSRSVHRLLHARGQIFDKLLPRFGWN